MEFFDAVRARRSVRRYQPSPVPELVIEKAFDAALLAPNSSNMQPWEFYWVRSPALKARLAEACFNQGAASTASDLVVAVARIDTWRRNRKLLLETMSTRTDLPAAVLKYYNFVVPLVYMHGYLQSIGIFKWLGFNVAGLFRPTPRKPSFRSEIFEVVVKTTALACENFMLAMAAQDYGTCPMEGFDEVRVKRLLGLNRHARVVMVIGCGTPAPDGIYGEQIRLPRELFIHKL